MPSIIVKQPNKAPFQMNLRDGQFTLELLQRLVNGHIEVVHPDGMPEGVVLICNEEGKLNDMLFNFYVEICGWPDAICGTCVFCAEGVNEFGEPDLVPLKFDQVVSVMVALSGVSEQSTKTNH